MKYLPLLVGMLCSILTLASDNNIGEAPFVLKIEQELLKKGNEYLLNFRAANTKSMIGYQFAIELSEGITFEEVIPGEIPFLTKNNFGCQKATEGLIFTNWFAGTKRTFVEDELVFSLKIKAEKDMSSVDAVIINHHKMATEAYKESGEHFGIELIFTQNGDNESSEFAIFPNPIKDKATIRSSISSASTIELLNAAGTVLNNYKPKNYTLLQNQIDLSEISSGIYLIRWTDGNGVVKTEKILKL